MSETVLGATGLTLKAYDHYLLLFFATETKKPRNSEAFK
ncbi:hypothetical protein PLIP_a1162 [Pseudoalteromonas lipolytica LMEB 39]|nr:hypothetical protein [Pseudoalteromonas lipolytica LMEB 39]